MFSREHALPRRWELVVDMADAWSGWAKRIGGDLARALDEREDLGTLLSGEDELERVRYWFWRRTRRIRRTLKRW